MTPASHRAITAMTQEDDSSASEPHPHGRAAPDDGAQACAAEHLAGLDELLREALLALGAAGQSDLACRIAAAAWSLLRREMPHAAQRYNGLLHRLTATPHQQRKDLP